MKGAGERPGRERNGRGMGRDGALDARVHPLALLGAAGHRARGVEPPPAGPSGPGGGAGCLMGRQQGRVVEVLDSFELRWEEAGSLDRGFLEQRSQIYAQVYPDRDIVGWYALGVEPTEAHLELQEVVQELNEYPLALMLDTEAVEGDAAGMGEAVKAERSLPGRFYECEVRVGEGGMRTLAASPTPYTVETAEEELIAVEQVTRALPPGAQADGTARMGLHLAGLRGAVQIFDSRMRTLREVLQAMQEGRVPWNHEFVRGAWGIVQRLPLPSEDASRELLAEHEDALAVAYLAALTKGVVEVDALVNKLSVLSS